ncbi:MAG TPA: bifunctional glutamate N-acetyltransferase/amino-acid acetyltransferase ArgJ [Thiotrichales bacterium]|nr:bifunctional glutamate N-acetyltransferase/amino-acid acetyltransferase ArgJ [Thiotrichales bacterium]
MPVGLDDRLHLLPVAGVRLDAAAAGIRYRGRDDLVLIRFARDTEAAAVFTRNAFCAAPVLVAREHLAVTHPRALLINAGNANAGTGEEGLAAARATCVAAARVLEFSPEEILPFSTGVIGEPLPVAPFEAALPRLVEGLHEEGWERAARAIMTTDTVPKGASRCVTVEGRDINVTGIAKGSGMIHPDMATMLAFLATDARVAREHLQMLLLEVTECSFNRVTVDGDTSTNDACVLAATGRSGVTLDPSHPEWSHFATAVEAVCVQLAQAMARDGEGATKFITIRVEGGSDPRECLQVAWTVAHSPLVKTAFFASDPNWGRILAAVGRAGLQELDISRVEIWLDDLCIVRDGGRDPAYTEEEGQMVMEQEEIVVTIRLGRGTAAETVWTTDLSHEYVRINAEYRT